MATVRRAVLPPYNNVGVNLRLIALEGYVANQRKQLHLFIQFAGHVIFLVPPIKPAELDPRQGPDSSKTATREFLHPCEGLQRFENLIAGVENYHKRFRPLFNLLESHGTSLERHQERCKNCPG